MKQQADINMIDSLRQLNFASMILRMLLAILVGGLVGLERERKGRGAGFRTYMLVALGSSLTMILSQYLNLMLNTTWLSTADIVGIKTDVSRFGAQVINGVGFLGAGAIIVTDRQEVKGLTTAAGLWASACIGLAVGAGFYECVFISFVLIILIMTVLPYIEKSFLEKSRYININIDLESIDKLSGVLNKLKEDNVSIFDIDVYNNSSESVRSVSVCLNLRLSENCLHENIIAILSQCDGVIAIDEI